MRTKAFWFSVYALGLILSIVPACIAVIDRFGFWNTDQKVSAAVILLIVICCVPLWKQIRNGIKCFAENPSIWGFWLGMTIIFRLFNAISDDMLIVCYVALCGSLVGAILMSLAHKHLKEDE